MGQYHLTVNLKKKEFINPHRLGDGLKLWEQLASGNIGKALIVLLAHPAQRGGGDLDVDQNWHGPERDMKKHATQPAPMPTDYKSIAARTIGRWRGDPIAIIGDYAEDGDIEGVENISSIYSLCRAAGEQYIEGAYTDVTDDVCAVIAHELNGRFIGVGWRKFISDGDTVMRWEQANGGQHRIEGKISNIKPKSFEVAWPTGVKKYTGEDPKIDFF